MAMQVELKSLESTEFRDALIKALAGSVVGDVVLSMMQKAATDYQVKQAIENAVREHMQKHAKAILAESVEFQAMLRSKVETLITEELMDNLIAMVKIDRY